MSIKKLIEQLDVEIQKVEDEEKKEAEIRRLQEIAAIYAGEDRLVSSLDIAERLKNAPEETKIMSGYTSLDEILKGFRLRQLVVISALTKSGKTSFCIDLTTRFKEYSPMWLPFEESAEELIQKFLDRNEQPPIFYTPEYMAGNTLEWVEMKVVEAKAKFDTKIVFIDQLDFIVPMGGDNHALRVGQAMRALKGIAKKWGVVIFIICHLVKTRMDTQPTLEDLKGSSSIGQEADTVILLWRETNRVNGQVVITNNTNISVQANRRTGSTGNVKMIFNNGCFLEQDWKHIDPDSDDSW